MGTKSRRRRNRKSRRQFKVFLKCGKKPRHKLKTGRTGKVHFKKMQSALMGSGMSRGQANKIIKSLSEANTSLEKDLVDWEDIRKD